MGRQWYGLLRRRLFNRIHQRISRSLLWSSFSIRLLKMLQELKTLLLSLKFWTTEKSIIDAQLIARLPFQFIQQNLELVTWLNFPPWQKPWTAN